MKEMSKSRKSSHEVKKTKLGTPAIVAIVLTVTLLLCLFYVSFRSYTKNTDTPADTERKTSESVRQDHTLTEVQAHRVKMMTPVVLVGTETLYEGDIAEYMSRPGFHLRGFEELSREEVINELVKESIMLQAGADEGRIGGLTEDFFNTYERNYDIRMQMLATIRQSLADSGIDEGTWLADRMPTFLINRYEN